MESGVFEIFGTRYYTDCFGIILVIPFFLWFIGGVIRTLVPALKKKPVKWYWATVPAACSIAMLVAVFWDVYHIGQEATRLCNEKAGLHVYKTVQAESVFGVISIRPWGEYGFKFTEGENDEGKIRYFYENGKPTYKTVDKILSRYEVVVRPHQRVAPGIEVLKFEVKDRHTGEVLGEAINYSIDGGWADMAFWGITGFGFSPWICSGKDGEGRRSVIYPSDLVKATIKPMNK